MSDLGAFLIGLIAGIPGAVAKEDEATRERILAALDECKRALSAIGPNAPTIRAAVERRLADLGLSPAVVAERAGIAQRAYGCTVCGVAIALVGDAIPATGDRCARCVELARTERGDEPTREIPPDISMGPRPR